MAAATAITSVPELRSPIGLAGTAASDRPITLAAPTVVAGGRGRIVLGWLEDAGLLLLVVFAFPLVILVVGAPVALFVRLLLEIARRWW